MVKCKKCGSGTKLSEMTPFVDKTKKVYCVHCEYYCLQTKWVSSISESYDLWQKGEVKTPQEGN